MSGRQFFVARQSGHDAWRPSCQPFSARTGADATPRRRAKPPYHRRRSGIGPASPSAGGARCPGHPRDLRDHIEEPLPIAAETLNRSRLPADVTARDKYPKRPTHAGPFRRDRYLVTNAALGSRPVLEANLRRHYFGSGSTGRVIMGPPSSCRNVAHGRGGHSHPSWGEVVMPAQMAAMRRAKRRAATSSKVRKRARLARFGSRSVARLQFQPTRPRPIALACSKQRLQGSEAKLPPNCRRNCWSQRRRNLVADGTSPTRLSLPLFL